MSIRRFALLTLMSLFVSTVALMFLGVAALAFDTHNYLTQFGEVPAVGPHGETIAMPGPLIYPKAMTVDGGEAYVAEGQAPSTSRLDKFSAATGAFIAQFPPLPAPLEYIAQGVAVGHGTGSPEVYVGADELREGVPFGVVTVYNSAGELQSVWKGTATAHNGFACFECGPVGDVAVDNSSGVLSDWAAGDVYVADPKDGVIDVFEPEAGGGEKKPVAELTGISPGESFSEADQVAVSTVNGDVVVADGSIGVAVFRPAPLAGQYEFVGKLAAPGDTFSTGEIRVDASDGEGDIYVLDNEKIYEFDAAGEYRGQVAPTTAPGGTWGREAVRPVSVAADRETHRVYVGLYDGNEPSTVFAFGPNIVLPDASTAPPTGVHPTGVTLNGAVDLEQAGPATCKFVWGTSPAALSEVTPCSRPVEGEGTVPVGASLSGLQPDTTYYYRLEATNANGTNVGEPGQDQRFTTPGPGIRAEGVIEVASTSATFQVTIDPDKAHTNYYFQYGESSAYGSEAPLAPGATLGATEGELQVSQRVQGLAADTVYHYRVVVVSELEVEAGVVEAVAFPGPDRTVTTQRAGGAFVLPDGRQWEQVSARNKEGGLIDFGHARSKLGTQASASGAAMTYFTTAPPEGDTQGNDTVLHLLSARGGSGWVTQSIALPHAGPTGVPVFTANAEEYRLFSEDLSLGLAEPFEIGFTSLAPYVFPPDTRSTQYLRHNLTCATTPGTCFEPLVTTAPGYDDVPAGATEFGHEAFFVDGTPDLAHVVLEAGGGVLYEWSSGAAPAQELRPASVLPQGEGGQKVAGKLGSAVGGMTHAISDNGTRVIWTGEAGAALYLRDMVREETVRLDAVQGGSGRGGAQPQFESASSDGARVFFTDTQRLTADSGAGAGEADLYECRIVEVSGTLRCALSDLTPGAQGANVQGGLLGASDEGSYLYFVARGALQTPENDRHETPEAGADNLYMLHYDSVTARWEAPWLIGVLSAGDATDWDKAGGDGGQPTRSSHNGRYLALMSERPLTGYDNRDAHSGIADQEVFLFDAAAHRLVCASCNPTGARPVGVEYGAYEAATASVDMTEEQNWPSSTWVAAQLPAALTTYESRALSDEGRVFFDTRDALVPQDINNTQDVYEYEPAGVGSCTASSSAFDEASRGCASLISSGTSPGESAFIDASENGDDVFLMTADALVPTDVDSAIDLYDAHACTSGSPCTASPAPSPSCVTADACRAAPSPQPAIYGVPSSATFSGAGNVAASQLPRAPQSRSLTRAQRLARSLAACRRRRGSSRHACERRARRRYGARSAHKTTTIKRGGR